MKTVEKIQRQRTSLVKFSNRTFQNPADQDRFFFSSTLFLMLLLYPSPLPNTPIVLELNFFSKIFQGQHFKDFFLECTSELRNFSKGTQLKGPGKQSYWSVTREGKREEKKRENKGTFGI